MSTTTRNVEYVLVGIDGATTPPANDISDLADGQIGVFNTGGTAGAITAGDKFVIALGGPSGAKFVSEAIDPAKIEISTRRATTPAIEQVNGIGFNGVSGSLDDSLAAGNLYFVSMLVQEYLTSNTDGRYIKQFQYSSISGDDQADIANGLFKSAIENFSREAEDYVAKQCMINHAGAAITGTTVSLVWTKGSKYVTAAAVNQTFTNVAAGDFIKVATATTNSTYKVVSVTNGTASTKGQIKLEVAFQEATVTVALATNFRITAALAAAADCGILLTGKPLSYVRGKEFYKKARWEVSARDFGASTIHDAVTASEGVGVYEQASNAEWFGRGEEGETYRDGFETLHQSVFNAVLGKTYDVTSIRFIDDSVVGFKSEVSPKQITIYSPTGVDYMDDVVADNGVWPQIKIATVAALLSKTTGAAGATTVTAGTLDV